MEDMTSQLGHGASRMSQVGGGEPLQAEEAGKQGSGEGTVLSGEVQSTGVNNGN